MKNDTLDREFNKFVEDSDGETAVRTLTEIKGAIEASFSPSGLYKEGRVTTVNVGTTWTALPAVPLNDRNAISIQNQSLVDIKINYRTDTGYEGILIKGGYERYYDIKDTIIIYARVASGSTNITVEELA